MNKNLLQLIFQDDQEILDILNRRDIAEIKKFVESFPVPKDGKDGEKPIKGVDYLTPEEVEVIKQEILKLATPIKGVNYSDGEKGEPGIPGHDGLDSIVPGPEGKQGIPGKDGSPDTPDEIAKKLNTLKGAVDVSVIKGAVTSKELIDGIAKVDGRVKLIDQRWHGGGLSNITGLIQPGTNVTITGQGTKSLPYIINSIASGGSGSPGGSNTQVQFNDSGSFGGASNLTYHKASGFVGIGESNPQAPLHITNTTPGIATFILQNASDDPTNRGEFFDFREGSGGTVVATWGHQKDFVFGDGTAQTFIAARVSDEPLTFIVGDAFAERMRIEPIGGKVGIATSTPISQLNVNGTIASTGYDSSPNPDIGGVYLLTSSDNPSFILVKSGGTADARMWDAGIVSDKTYTFRALNDAYTDGTPWLSAHGMYGAIDSVVFPMGNVGVDITSPVTNFQVGDIYTIDDVTNLNASQVNGVGSYIANGYNRTYYCWAGKTTPYGFVWSQNAATFLFTDDNTSVSYEVDITADPVTDAEVYRFMVVSDDPTVVGAVSYTYFTLGNFYTDQVSPAFTDDDISSWTFQSTPLAPTPNSPFGPGMGVSLDSSNPGVGILRLPEAGFALSAQGSAKFSGNFELGSGIFGLHSFAVGQHAISQATGYQIPVVFTSPYPINAGSFVLGQTNTYEKSIAFIASGDQSNPTGLVIIQMPTTAGAIGLVSSRIGSSANPLILQGSMNPTNNTAARVGIGINYDPTGRLEIGAGNSSYAALVLNNQTLLGTPQACVIEPNGDDLYYTITTGSSRKKFVLSDSNLTSGKYPIATTNGRLTDGPTPLAGTKIYYVSDTSGGAVTRKLTFTNGILTSET